MVQVATAVNVKERLVQVVDGMPLEHQTEILDFALFMRERRVERKKKNET